MKRTIWIAVAALVAAAGGTVAWACAGGDDDSPRWALATRTYVPFGSSAFLSPGNDTRVNLFLLLADRHTDEAIIRSEQASAPNALFSWATLAARGDPPEATLATSDEDGFWKDEQSRCQTLKSGAAAFSAAVRFNAAIPEAEKVALITAREGLNPWVKPESYGQADCGGAGSALVALPTGSSPAGKEFAGYLAGTASFYVGDFSAANQSFTSLAKARDPWVRETALYMVARTSLNMAQERAFSEYGTLADPKDRDLSAIGNAGRQFDAYLAAYPSGRYSNSARGLLRRVSWLAGDTKKLSSIYSTLLAEKGAPQGFADDAELAQEIDLKIFSEWDDQGVSSPLLLAVRDLQRMREREPDSGEGADCYTFWGWCGRPISEAEIESQRDEFGDDAELFDYVRAAHAFFIRHQPAEVVKLIPDAARQRHFTYLQFSRQLLRGLALEALGDPNARGLMLEMFGGADRPFQHDALELALAMHDEKTGNLSLVFAPDSKIRNPFIRQILIERIAGPNLLRRQVKSGVRQQERDAALYVLLAKELRHGLYADFLNDVALVRPGANTDGYYGHDSLTADTLAEYSNDALQNIPTGIFTGRIGGAFGCPKVIDTVAILARLPSDIRARLCIGEFMRDNDALDPFVLDEPIAGGGLASTKQLFPGKIFQRLDVYRSIIGDPSATADQKALALNRALRCYRPESYIRCGGAEADPAQRKAWFQLLKTRYAATRWARELKYYW